MKSIMPLPSTQHIPIQPPSRIMYDLNRITPLTQGNKSTTRAALLILARAAERAERYDDVCRFMREIIKLITSNPVQSTNLYDTTLTLDERQLLWYSYKQLLQQLRYSLKVTSKYETDDIVQQASHATGLATYTDIIDDYKQYIELECTTIAGELVTLIENTLLKLLHDNENRTFYLRLCGDYYKYLAEVQPIRGYERRSLDLYAQSWRIATTTLPVNHPTRLSVALNYSVCLYEMFRDKKAASEIAKSAFDAAIHKLDELDEMNYKDSTLIMQLLRDNLTLWTSIEQQQTEQK